DLPRPAPFSDRETAFRLDLDDVAPGRPGPGKLHDDADTGGLLHGELDVLRRGRDGEAKPRAAITPLVAPARGPAGRDPVQLELAIGTRPARRVVGRLVAAVPFGSVWPDADLDVGERPSLVVDDPARHRSGARKFTVVGSPPGLAVEP